MNHRKKREIIPKDTCLICPPSLPFESDEDDDRNAGIPREGLILMLALTCAHRHGYIHVAGVKRRRSRIGDSFLRFSLALTSLCTDPTPIYCLSKTQLDSKPCWTQLEIYLKGIIEACALHLRIPHHTALLARLEVIPRLGHRSS
jgi:hypothetical protein